MPQLKCKAHNANVIEIKAVNADEKVIKCPIDGCESGFTHIEGIGLILGSRKPEEFGLMLPENTPV